MNIKRNKSVIGKGLAVTVIALVAIVGTCAFAPSPAASGNSISLKNIRTDKSVTFPSEKKIARGSWFVEMVAPSNREG